MESPVKQLKIIEKISSAKPVKIIAFGDSLTYGWMVNRGYIDFLSDMIREEYPDSSVKFINRGVPGDTAKDGLRRISEVTGKEADLVMVQFGLNDIYTGFTADQFQDNIEKLIKEIRGAMDTEIALLTSVYINMPREYAAVLEFYKRINTAGEKHGLAVANVHSWWEHCIQKGTDIYSLVQGDGVHPTEEGYRLFAEAVMRLFK